MKKIILSFLVSISVLISIINADDSTEIFMCKNKAIAPILTQVSYITDSSDSVFVYYPKTLTKDKNIISAWIVILNTRDNNMAYDDNEGYTKVLYQIDTKNKKYKMVKLTGFDCDGKVSVNYPNNNNWEYIQPNSVGEAIYKKFIGVIK